MDLLLISKTCYLKKSNQNKVLKEEQMDVQIRYWNQTAKLDDTQFFESPFLRRSNAKNLFDYLITSLKDLPCERLFQLFMHVSNTNWSILTMFHENRCEKNYQKIIDIGCCSLHFLQVWC